MELDSFKAILLRKAEGNKNLHVLIEDVGEDFLVDSVVDALEKMAKPTHLTGTNANGPVTSFGANLDRTDMTQLRDALGHHLSHYKAALKAHHAAPEGPEKTKMRDVADQHLEHALPLMHLAARAGAHSKGKMGIDYPPLAPWETNYTTLQRASNGSGRFLRDAKLLRARPSKSSKKRTDPSSDPNSTAIPDYHYLEMPPHPGHDAVSKMPHSGGYPWEDVQIGAPADIDAKKAYLPIEDVPDKKEYTPHEFDKHPVRALADVQADHLTDEAHQAHANDVMNWRSGDEHKKWMEGQKQKYAADKEGYMKRGQTKSAPLYEGVPLKEQLSHVRDFPAKPKFQASQEPTQAATPAAKESAPAHSDKQNINPDDLPKSLRHLVGAVPPKVRKPAEKTEAKAAPSTEAPHPYEDMYQAWKSMPKDQQERMSAIPAFKKYIDSKGGK